MLCLKVEVPKQKVKNCLRSGKNKDTLKKHLYLSVWLSVCWNNGPKSNEKVLRDLMLEGEKGWVRGDNSLVEKFQPVLTTSQTALEDETEANLHRGCLHVHIFHLLFKFCSHFRTFTSRWTWRVYWVLFLFSIWSHRLHFLVLLSLLIWTS